MKSSIVWTALLVSLTAGAAQESPSETPALAPSEYRLPMEEVTAIGRLPYWRQTEAPRWEQPSLELQQTAKSRLQWLPNYTRDERDDSKAVHDPANPQARTKVFEVRF